MQNARWTRIAGGQWVVLSPDSNAEHTTIVVEKRGKQPQRVAVGARIGTHKSGMWLYEIDKARGGKGPQAAKDSLPEYTPTPGGPEAPLPPAPVPPTYTGGAAPDAELAADASDAEKLAGVLADMMSRPAMDEDRVRELVAEYGMNADAVRQLVLDNMPEHARVTIDIRASDDAPLKEVAGTHHKVLPKVLSFLACNIHVYLVGPAGSGKTHLAESVAEALGRTLYVTGAMLTKHEVLGYQTATGEYVTTAARQAYEFGGILLWDEVDASQPAALVAVNAMLSNSRYTFPDGTVERHADFIVLAAGNTYGRGADREYVGRLQLDGATLDRFATIEMDYDAELEQALGMAEYAAYQGADIAIAGAFIARIQALRAAASNAKLRHIISPRATIYGCRLLARGMDQATILEHLVYKGMPGDSRKQLEGSV